MKTNSIHVKSSFRFFLVAWAALGLLMMSGFFTTTAYSAEIPYNPAEVQKIKAFLEKQSMVDGKTNADLLGITNLNDPGSWTGVGWTDKHPDSPILEPIMLENKYVQYIQWPQSLGSSLEISGFTYLQLFDLYHLGGSYGNRSKYTDISIHDNPRLESIRIVYASVGIIRITQNPKLYGVSLDLVDTRELVIESPVLRSLGSSTMGSGSLNFAAYPLLEDLHLTGCEYVTTLDLSSCPNIGNLSASGMKTMKAIRFGNKRGLIATISGNPVLTSLDFRGFQPVSLNCSENSSLISFQIDRNSPLKKAEIEGNNALTKLDLSYQPGLETLNCEGNKSLKELLLKGNTSLGYIYCNNCALTSLDVSGLNSLKILEASGNQLAEFSAKGVQFTKLALLWNKLKKISANVAGFNINVKSYKEYGYVSFNTSKDIENPYDPNTYFYIQYDGLKDPDPHTYFREIAGTGLPVGNNAWKSSFPIKSDIDVTLYFDGYVHFVSWYESATGDPYDEKAVLSQRFVAGKPIGPAPPAPDSKFPPNIPAPSKKGHILQGWYKDMSLTQPWNLLTDSLTAELVLFPYWVPVGMPVVLSVKRQLPTTENATSDKVAFQVTFSKTVSGVDISDFILKSDGTVTGKISAVSASSGNTISVEVNSISGTGTLRLDMKSTGTGIVDADSNPLSGGYTSGEIYRVGPPTGISDQMAINHDFKILPNPTSGMLCIETTGNEQVSGVELQNLQGKLVTRQELRENGQLDLSALPPGIYILQLHAGTKTLVRKIVKTNP